MPVLKYSIERLLNKLPNIKLEDLQDALFRLKCETELLEEGLIEVEINPDRPDMYSEEGIIRAVRGILGLEKGWKTPITTTTDISIANMGTTLRPYIAGAVVYNVDIQDEEDLRQLIQFQEKLHDTLGRRRKKIAIGFHDLDKLPSSQLFYKELYIDQVFFEPLGENEKRSAAEILQNTEQGQKYGHISLWENKHPFLFSGEYVIAMPPVINSNITRVEVGTRHLFIDVTGTNKDIVNKVLDIIVSNLAERPGVKVGLVEIREKDKVHYTPRLSTTKVKLSLEYVTRNLGYSLEPIKAKALLQSMRYNVNILDKNTLMVEIPPFRIDYISPIDLVEDLAIAIGYENLYPLKPQKYVRGSILLKHRLIRQIREILIGLGYTEIVQLTLTNPEYAELVDENPIRIKNPVQREYSVLRPELFVTFASILEKNQHLKKPLKLFEIGKIAYIDEDNSIIEKDMVGIVILDEENSVEKIQAPLYALLELLDIEFKVEPVCIRESLFIKGRCGRILVNNKTLAYFGEIHPKILETIGVEFPTAYAALDLEVLSEWKSKM